jgi:hypothetical protein
MPDDQLFSPNWLTKIDSEVNELTGLSLVSLNDEKKFTFEEIGMLLQMLYLE